MVFSSIFFLYIFLPTVLVMYAIAPKVMKNLLLLLASIVFYAWGEPVYIILMIFSAAFNYVCGLEIARQRTRLGARKNLALAVVVNLFLLFFFKYFGFLVDTINSILGTHLGHVDLALPIGISFYTFQTLSYIIDVYRGNIKVQKNFINFSLYITMFPQLIAGPIVRYIDIEPELKKRSVTLASFGMGAQWFVRGLTKKVILANNIGSLATTVSAMVPGEQTVVTSWIGIIAYTFQIYFDFSGYSDMAIGLGKMFGFNFMKNFDHPYLSKSVTEFWRRWHISLGTWFREYVYIPLGGNRVSVLKHLRNILVVWMLTGLWHGASWNFIVWGLYYGILLLVEKYFLAEKLERAPAIVGHVYALLAIVIGWVFFSHTEGIGGAFRYIGNMFGIGGAGFANATTFYYLKSYFILLLLCIACSGQYLNTLFKKIVVKIPWIAVVINVCLFILCTAYLVYDTYNPFLYFRF